MTPNKVFDVEACRKDFPCLNLLVHQKPLVYFDSAATTQKPQAVIDAVSNYYQQCCGNVNRGAHYVSEVATKHYQESRLKVAQFLHAQPDEIVFTRGTTESINLVASCLGRLFFEPGDEIIVTEMEHHSNIVPWYLVAKEKDLRLKVAPVLDDGSLDIDAFKNLFTDRTKLVAFTHASNALGTINPVKEMVQIARGFGAVTLIDGAQAAPHVPINVVDSGVDFYCLSGHKLYGPTGIGVLYAKRPWLDRLPPYQGGGDMIESVSFEHITFAKGPQKFEAGTQNIAGALGLKAAIQYVMDYGFEAIHAHEQLLHDYMLGQLLELKQVRVIGTASNKVSLVSFIIDGVHPHDISSILDRDGIAIRAGHLCAQPLMARFKTSALSRASLSFYNTKDEIDHFIQSLAKVFKVFRI